MSAKSLFSFNDLKVGPDSILTYSKERTEDHIIVIDNGSYNCRMGWNDSLPFQESDSEAKGLVYKSVMVKTRREKGKESELHVANDIPNIEAVRFNLKTPFDRNVVTQFQNQEIMLDYGFSHLGLDNDSCVPHPVILTEAVANPNSCRASMNELLFECYGIPRVSYGIDSMFSLYKNQPNFAKTKCTALVISFGFHTVHLLPVVNGKIDAHHIRRLNVGGFHLTNHLHRGLQLKYSAHANSIFVGRAEEMLQDHCYTSIDFGPDLGKWSDVEYYQKNVHRMQLPFTPAAKPPPVDPEVLKLRRQELAKRLVEINARKREEKLQEDEALLKTLHSSLGLLEQGYDDKVKRMLAKSGLTASNASDIEQHIVKTKAKIEKAKRGKKKDDVPVVEQEQPAAKKRREDMDEDEQKEFDTWLDDVRNKRKELLDHRAARHLRRKQLAKRRTAASQERMRMISQLAKHSKKDDNFGMNDDDWDVYKKIRRDVGDSDSEEEQERLAEYETVLKEHDSTFGNECDDEIPHDSPEWYQLHLATERIRVPEIFFQPSIVGHDQAGISESIEFVLAKYDEEERQALASNVFVTGAPARLPGLLERLAADLVSIRPFKSHTKVTTAANPTIDAWLGQQLFANDHQKSQCGIWTSKADYEEIGSDQLKEHQCSNIYHK